MTAVKQYNNIVKYGAGSYLGSHKKLGSIIQIILFLLYKK